MGSPTCVNPWGWNMSPDVLYQLRSYADQLDEQAASYEEVAAPPTPVRRGEEPWQRRSRRGWAIAIAAAVFTVLVVAVPLILLGGDSDDAPVATQPAPELTIPPPTTEPAPTSEASSSSVVDAPANPLVPAALGMNWERVPADVALENGWISAVTAGGPGLVAVGGSTARGDAQVWLSADGVSWERIDSDVFGGQEEDGLRGDGNQVMTDVVSGPFGLVAVGADENGAAVWLSNDGRSWSRVPHDEEVFGGVGGPAMERVVVGGPGLVAIGSGPEGSAGDGTGAVWVSADAITWTQVVDDDFEVAGENISMTDLTLWNGLLVAVGNRNSSTSSTGMDWLRPAVWLSSDGLSWERLPEGAVPMDPGDIGDVAPGPGMVIKAVATSEGGLVAVGTGLHEYQTAVWTSDNGRDWSLLAGEFYSDDPPYEAFWGSASIAELDGRLVASFMGSDSLWASDDGGATWHEAAQFEGGFDEVSIDLPLESWGTLNHVISTPTSLLAVGSVVEWSSTEDLGDGCYTDGDGSRGWCRLDAAVWIGQWNE